jgi:hypothetical protein
MCGWKNYQLNTIPLESKSKAAPGVTGKFAVHQVLRIFLLSYGKFSSKLLAHFKNKNCIQYAEYNVFQIYKYFYLTNNKR